jgi:hypothetical protein
LSRPEPASLRRSIVLLLTLIMDKMNPHDKARAWRLRHNLHVDTLVMLSGYSRETIYAMERNECHGKPIEKWVFQRYQRACEGVDCELRTGRKFDW